MTDNTSQTTNTHYVGGFLYTEDHFFPHTSTSPSADSDGYVKALAAGLGGGTSYDFKYIFTHTDHTLAAQYRSRQHPPKIRSGPEQ